MKKSQLIQLVKQVMVEELLGEISGDPSVFSLNEGIGMDY